VLVNFIDNHDVARLLYWAAQNKIDNSPGRQRALLHNALLLLMTAEGIPCLYYGTEQEFRGGNDPSNREDMWRPLPYLGRTPRPRPTTPPARPSRTPGT
jgi:glycosidase